MAAREYPRAGEEVSGFRVPSGNAQLKNHGIDADINANLLVLGPILEVRAEPACMDPDASTPQGGCVRLCESCQRRQV